MKVVFVENHPGFARQVLTHFLSDLQVTIVPSRSAARASLMEHDFEVVLVDYDLDDGKGVEPVRELRESGKKCVSSGFQLVKQGMMRCLRPELTHFAAR
jgi:DNA-binding response OmpR family regulator